MSYSAWKSVALLSTAFPIRIGLGMVISAVTIGGSDD